MIKGRKTLQFDKEERKPSVLICMLVILRKDWPGAANPHRRDVTLRVRKEYPFYYWDERYVFFLLLNQRSLRKT